MNTAAPPLAHTPSAVIRRRDAGDVQWLELDTGTSRFLHLTGHCGRASDCRHSRLKPVRARWLVFLHSSDEVPPPSLGKKT